jgi:outer membrane protein OmpA-like peptidoglycan-associated protein
MNFVTHFLFIATICFAFSAKAQLSQCTTTDKKINKALNEALAQVGFEAQVMGLAQVVQKYPENVQAYYQLGRLHYQQGMRLGNQSGNSKEAEKLLRNALVFYQGSLQKCPSYQPDTYYYCARILYSFSEMEAAYSYLAQFMSFDSLYPGELSPLYAKMKSEIEPVYRELRFAPEAKKNPVPFNVIKVEGASTKEDEYFPMLSPDNSLLFYTRKADKTNLGDIAGYVQEEFTVSSWQEQFSFDQGMPLPYPFNDGTFHNYGSASLSADNRELILCACKAERVYNKDYLNCDLYSTHSEPDPNKPGAFLWSPLVNLGPNINTKDGWEAQPSLAADGKTLYFTSLRKGSQDNDIYFSNKLPDGTWGPAEPFTLINTAGKDKSPFFHQDGETFYFVSQSSRERPGMGGLDIFMMRKEGNGWGPVQNIGFPINTPADELGIFVSTDGKRAYFSSAKDQNWDIYSFDLYAAARPKETRILTGRLEDATGNGIGQAEISLRYANSDKAIQSTQSNADGTYALAIQVDQKVLIEASKEGYSFQAQIIDTNTLHTPSNKIETPTLQIDSLKEGSAYTLEAIYFDTDKSELSADARLILDGFVAYLRKRTHLAIKINGHTDDIGDAQHNQQLSEQRALEVMDYIVSAGINEARIQYEGFGKNKPRVPNNSAENRALNRRTEFQIISID